MKISVSALLSVGLLATTSSPALAVGQLPAGVRPLVYDITVNPDATSKTFTGSETVTVQVTKPTRTVTLNAADLTITSASFDGKPARVSLNAAKQELTLTLAARAKPGKHVIAFKWRGKINDTAAGLFAIDYANLDGKPARMLVTQFEAPDARRFAPMWDEPSFKARFRLSAVAPGNQTAFSNMPTTSITKRADGSQLYRFAETPLMSSYLLFLGMGDVERKTVLAGKTEIGVITRRGVVDQGDYALASAQKLLAYYNDYFGQPYPLPKLDMIAGPGSSQFFGAMENWGAIFYFEPELLFDPKRSTESSRNRIHTVVAHEIAHQWFGNLVTMAWWDDLWLNEGFASWMESKASNDLNPQWFVKAETVAKAREGAMGIDATAATHPVIRPVATVDQLGEAFDSITYQKGQAVIGMIESTLGADVFREGIRRYMAKYKYGNTQTDQLWAELALAAGKPVADIAHDFTLQGGVPLIEMNSAICSKGSTQVSLVQGRFGLDQASKAPQRWRVPLSYGFVGGPVSSTIVQGPVANTINLPGCGTLILNRDKGSYVRIKYDESTHAAIVKDYAKLDLTDRLGTMGDDFALALSGDQSLDRYFDIIKAVDLNGSPLEWWSVSGNLGAMTGLFLHTDLEAPLRARTNALLAPIMARVGFQAQPGEAPLVTNLRETLVSRLGANGQADVVAQARMYVGALATDPNAIPPAIRQPILSTFANSATPSDWDALLKLTREATNPVVRNSYVRLLGQARDETLGAKALELLKGSDFSSPQKAVLLSSIAGRHPDMAFDFAVANLDLVNGFLEASSRTGFVVGLGAGSNDPAMPGKITTFAEKNLPEASRGGVKRALTAIAVRKRAADRLRAGLATWLAAGA